MFLIKEFCKQNCINIFFNPCNFSLNGLVFSNEILTTIDLIGFFVATVGVYIAENKLNNYTQTLNRVCYGMIQDSPNF